MASPKDRIGRMLLTSLTLWLAIASSGCSYSIPFNIRNLSGGTITVGYTVKEINDRLAPMLLQRNTVENRMETVPIPDDRILIDKENGHVEFKLFANEEVELHRVTDGRDLGYYEQKFNLKSLRIEGEEGLILLEGREVFKSFRPLKGSWYAFGPEIIGFVFEYR